MKAGDLVKRKEDRWDWLTFDEINEIGIVVGIEEFSTKEKLDKLMVVLWSTPELSWEDMDDLEIANESR